MKYTADTWFFIQLSNGISGAQELWKEIKSGKSRLVVPTIVLVELKKILLRRGLTAYAEELTNELEASQKISLVDLTVSLAKEAGALGNTYLCTTSDAVILATALMTGFTAVITDDAHFLAAEKQGKIKIVRF